MGRKYIVKFENVTVALPQDLVQIAGAAGKLIRVLREWVNHPTSTLATGQGLRLRSRILPAIFTVGSGGTTGVTPTKLDPGDATCSASTCAINNTGKATTSGTALEVNVGGCHLYQGWNWVYDDPIPVHTGQGFVFELLSTPVGTVTLSGGCLIEEIG